MKNVLSFRSKRAPLTERVRSDRLRRWFSY
jgi:hypothetical protein